ncbi:MAG TPA: ATP-binding protein [Clostridia bacterium]
MGSEQDIIELILPFKAEYVSLARLAVSSVANRMGFDMEAIEDIKVALSEVCNKLVGMGNGEGKYRIRFCISGKKLQIEFYSENQTLGCIFEGDEELGISIINALMDEVELCSDKDYIISMSITLKGDI